MFSPIFSRLALGLGVLCAANASATPLEHAFSEPTSADSTAPEVPTVRPVPGSGGNVYAVKLPGQPLRLVRADELDAYLTAHAQTLLARFPPTSASGADRPWTGLRDELSTELEQLLGETEASIMGGIRSEVENLVEGALGSALGVSPISEVARLRALMKEGLSTQQKIAYQDLKADRAWQKAHTELSPHFVAYYNAVDMPTRFASVTTQAAGCERALTSSWLTSGEVNLYRQAVRRESDVRDLVVDVRTVCHEGGYRVWMAESDRVAVIDDVLAELHRRAEVLSRIRNQLHQAAVHRRRVVAEASLWRQIYRPGNGLNRTVTTRPIR